MAEENSSESGDARDQPELAAGSPPSPASDADVAAQAGAAAGPGDAPSSASVQGVTAPAKLAALTPGQRLAAKKAQKSVQKREFKAELKREEEAARQKELEEADRVLGRARPEPGLPVEVEKVASGFTHFLQDNRPRILLGVGAAIALAGAALGVQHFLRSGSGEQAAELGQALELATAPVDAEDADGKSDDGKQVFKSERARAEKASAAFAKVVNMGAERPAAVWAGLAQAASELALGRFEDARARFQRVHDAHADQPELAGRALEGVAVALEASGKRDEALKTYQKLEAIEGNKELAQYQVARLKLAQGDREGGKSLLKALYDQLSTPTEGSAPSRYLRTEVEVRLAELDSALVDKGSASGPQQFSDEQLQRLIEQLQQKGKTGAGSE